MCRRAWAARRRSVSGSGGGDCGDHRRACRQTGPKGGGEPPGWSLGFSGHRLSLAEARRGCCGLTGASWFRCAGIGWLGRQDRRGGRAARQEAGDRAAGSGGPRGKAAPLGVKTDQDRPMPTYNAVAGAGTKLKAVAAIGRNTDAPVAALPSRGRTASARTRRDDGSLLCSATTVVDGLKADPTLLVCGRPSGRRAQRSVVATVSHIEPANRRRLDIVIPGFAIGTVSPACVSGPIA